MPSVIVTDTLGRPSAWERSLGWAVHRSSLALLRAGRGIGSLRFLAWQSAFLAAWLGVNLVLQIRYQSQHPGCLHLSGGVAVYSPAVRCSTGSRPPDPLPFTLTTLLLSMQAAFAAPVILLSTNQDVDRSRRTTQVDRETAREVTATVRYLQVEAAALHGVLNHAMTRDDVRRLLTRPDEV